MRRSMIAMTAAVLLAAAATAPTTAEARRGAFAAGIIGGLSAGAIIGGAGYPYSGYGYYPGYYAPAPAYYGPPPGCVMRQQRVWDGYAWRRRMIRVCY